MIPANITEAHIREALITIYKQNLGYSSSLLKKHGVIFNNDIYPLRLIISTANSVAGNPPLGVEDIKEKESIDYIKQFHFEIMEVSQYPFSDSNKLRSQIKKYNEAIYDTDWLRVNEVYKFNFIRWIDNNISFEGDSDDIKQKFELAQQQRFDEGSSVRGVNFLQTIKRYNHDYITTGDIDLLKKVATSEVAYDASTPQLSSGSYPKASLFLAFFKPDDFTPYDSESSPAYEFFNPDNTNIPKKGYSAFRFNQIFYQNVREVLKESKLDTSIFKEILQTENLTNLHWNWITQDFLLYTAKNMNSTIPAYYCVGFHYYSVEETNQLERFIRDNVWENGYDDKFLNIVNNVPVGSMLAAKTSYTMNEEDKTISVLEVHCIGKVTGNPKNGKTLNVQWEKDFEPFILKRKGAYRKTISQVHNQENINAIFYNDNDIDTVAEDEDNTFVNTSIPLNQIFYGAPGTGKTYTTKKAAVEIIDNIEYESREEILNRYNELVASGQIVFTTFHQSISYEDFIEGIKPETIDNTVIYEVKDGIFKHLSVMASKEVLKTTQQETAQKQLALFEDAWNKLIEDAQEKWGNNENLSINTITNKSFEVIAITNQGNLTLRPVIEGGLDYTVSFTRAKKLYEAFPSLEGIKNIDQEFRAVIGGMNATAYWSVLNYLKNNTSEIAEIKSVNEPPKKYVLIIDEINRGNISSIFGELITLIEEDKRKGVLQEREETIEVELPYSNDKFSVPDNLYVIGTMNTADRSVEALDTALRRRFSFVEMQADVEELRKNHKDNSNAIIIDNEQEIDLALMLQAINDRIELLIDKDHQIGHSFLIKTSTLEELKRVFSDKILPLLEEYFYGDYGKIGLVLGEEFITKKYAGTQKPKFATFSYGEEGDYTTFSDKVIYEFKSPVNWTAVTFKSIYA